MQEGILMVQGLQYMACSSGFRGGRGGGTGLTKGV